MPRPDFPRSILEFQRRLPDEDACRRYLFASRWPYGSSCPCCGGRAAGEQPKRRLWECRACGHQTSVTAGTVMHATRTPLQVWFWAAYLVATHHPGISAVQLKRQLGIGRYETAWLMLHKLRRATVAPERDPLTGPVEVDAFYVGGLGEGRGGDRKSDSSKAIVAAAVELARQGLGAPAAGRHSRPVRGLAVRVCRHRGGGRRDGAHRRLAGLSATESPGL